MQRVLEESLLLSGAEMNSVPSQMSYEDPVLKAIELSRLEEQQRRLIMQQEEEELEKILALSLQEK